MNILNITNTGNLDFEVENAVTRPLSAFHIRVQQRSARSCLTLIDGFADDLDLKKIIKAFKKRFQTNGAIMTKDTGETYIQLQGDKREELKQFLIDYKIWEEADGEIIVHGF